MGQWMIAVIHADDEPQNPVPPVTSSGECVFLTTKNKQPITNFQNPLDDFLIFLYTYSIFKTSTCCDREEDR